MAEAGKSELAKAANEVVKSSLVPETPSQPRLTRQRIIDVTDISPVQLELRASQSQCDNVNINLTPSSSKRKREKKKVYWPKIFDESKTNTKRTCKSHTNNSVNPTPKPSTPKQRKSYVRKPSCMGPLFPEDSVSLPFLEKPSKVEETVHSSINFNTRESGPDNSLFKNELGIEYNSLQRYQELRSFAGPCLIKCRRIGINFPINCRRKRKGRERVRLEKLLVPFEKGKRSKSFMRKRKCWMVFNPEGKIGISRVMRSRIRKIKRLKKKSDQKKKREQKKETNERKTNQVVAYKEHQTVPYKGPPSKYQGEVELDGETLRVWNLLTDGGTHEDNDQEKQKYWKEKMYMLQKRIQIFMTRIHETLGDRSFLLWKGSVMDSVVGVFLTQNVSDFLSSEAFMNLAAKFPAKTTSCGSETMVDLNIPDSNGPEFDKEIEDNKVEEVEAKNAKDSSEVDSKATENNSSVKMPAMISDKKKLAEQEKEKIKKEKELHWDMLRKMYTKSTRHSDHEDIVDWEAVRCAKLSEFAETIQCRGQHNIIAAKIQRLLNHLKDKYGNMDLEWLRYAPPKDVKEYLLSIYGLGLKSVECIRLLALQHSAFPVDVNVGRIVVRLGWVPLKPLPESVQIHELVKFPKEEDIQRYLWPRLWYLDWPSKYLLHYQLISAGKIVCTKGEPNCNACPMREEGCKYYESKLASKKLALPGPTADKRPTDNKMAVTSMHHANSVQCSTLPSNSSSAVKSISEVNKSPITEQQESYEIEPIIEMPASPPEPEIEESDDIQLNIEEFYEDDVSEDIDLTINLTCQESRTHDYSWEGYENDMNMSRDLVALPANVANTPVPKMKRERRTRTERLVYVLPDNHPLLEKHTPRLPDDRNPYLLVQHLKGELKGSCESTEDNSQEEDNSKTVPCTILIPLRTAMGGRFPLNGTYFQINEVFADYDSLHQPINVPRGWLWNLEKRFTYFGTGISSIMRDMTSEEIQNFFWNHYVCVKAIEAKTRFPRPLTFLLHRKLQGNKNGRVNEE